MITTFTGASPLVYPLIDVGPVKILKQRKVRHLASQVGARRCHDTRSDYVREDRHGGRRYAESRNDRSGTWQLAIKSIPRNVDAGSDCSASSEGLLRNWTIGNRTDRDAVQSSRAILSFCGMTSYS